MDSLGKKAGETAAHLRLKRLALLWAQAHGYAACGLEVSLPRCRYRADVAAFKSGRAGGSSAIFECKQALVDLRRDNGSTLSTRRRLEATHIRREILEKHLRIHYLALRIPDSLFAEFDSHNFAAINHRGYNQVARQLRALQHRLFDCTKFETLARYRCANLLLLVLPNELFRESEIPASWGALIETGGRLVLARKPVARNNSGHAAQLFATNCHGRHAYSKSTVRDYFRPSARRSFSILGRLKQIAAGHFSRLRQPEQK